MDDDLVDVQIVLPERDDNALSAVLRKLTAALEAGEPQAYGLGGEHGYGFNFENDLFMMHRYCWCEQDGCPWCGGDAGPFAQNAFWGGDVTTRAPNFWHKPSGLKIWWYKYIGRGMNVETTAGVEPYKIVMECIESLKPPR